MMDRLVDFPILDFLADKKVSETPPDFGTPRDEVSQLDRRRAGGLSGFPFLDSGMN